MRSKAVVLMMLLFTLAVSDGFAQRGSSWELIGRRDVNHKVDRDVIKPHRHDSFRFLKIKVENATVEFLSIDVEFDSGRNMNIPIRSVIRSGGESRVIDLPGDKRKIKKVTFIYKGDKAHRGKRAKVELWGK